MYKVRVPLPPRDILMTDPPANLESIFPHRKNIEVVICFVKYSEYNTKLHSACVVITCKFEKCTERSFGISKCFAPLCLFTSHINNDITKSSGRTGEVINKSIKHSRMACLIAGWNLYSEDKDAVKKACKLKSRCLSYISLLTKLVKK